MKFPANVSRGNCNSVVDWGYVRGFSDLIELLRNLVVSETRVNALHGDLGEADRRGHASVTPFHQFYCSTSE
jgi:hypothetical protein